MNNKFIHEQMVKRGAVETRNLMLPVRARRNAATRSIAKPALMLLMAVGRDHSRLADNSLMIARLAGSQE